MLGYLGKVSFGMLKLDNLGVVSFGWNVEMSFVMLRLSKLGDLSFGMLRLGVLGKAS